MASFGGALGSANFQEAQSPDTTSAPPMPDQTPQQPQLTPGAQKIAGGSGTRKAEKAGTGRAKHKSAQPVNGSDSQGEKGASKFGKVRLGSDAGANGKRAGTDLVPEASPTRWGLILPVPNSIVTPEPKSANCPKV